MSDRDSKTDQVTRHPSARPVHRVGEDPNIVVPWRCTDGFADTNAKTVVVDERPSTMAQAGCGSPEVGSAVDALYLRPSYNDVYDMSQGDATTSNGVTVTVLDDIYPAASTIELRIDAPGQLPVRASIGVGPDPITARTILSQLGRHPNPAPAVKRPPAPSSRPGTSATSPPSTATTTTATQSSTTDDGMIRFQATVLHAEPITAGQDVNLWVWQNEPGAFSHPSVESGAWRLLYQKVHIDAAGSSTRTASGPFRSTLTITIPPEGALWIKSAEVDGLAATNTEPDDPKVHQPDPDGHVPGEPPFNPGSS